MYELRHPHILQVEALNPASVFPLRIGMIHEDVFHRIFKILFIKHPQYQQLEFIGHHYTIVAEYFMRFLDTP